MIIAHSERVGTAVAARDVTVKVALAGAALLPLLVTKAPAGSVLVRLPAVEEVTFTFTVQVPAAAGARVPCGITAKVARLTVVVPASAVTMPPAQVVLAFGVAAITMPAGKLSVSGEVILSGVSTLELDSVMVRVDVPPAVIVVGLKLLLTVGATAPIFKGALSEHPPMVLPPVAIVTTPTPVTAPASKRPVTLPPPDVEMLVSAITVPMKEVPFSVAEVPTRQYTLHGFAVPVTTELPFIVSELETLNTNTPELSGEGSLSVKVVEAPKSAAPDE